MNNAPTYPASIVVSASTPQPRAATAHRPTAGVSGADIVVAPFTPVAPPPKIKAASAKTSSAEWPLSAATLAAIKADIDDAGPDAKKDVRGHILIASCIDRGIDAGTHIRSVGMDLGFNGQHIGRLLRSEGAPWRKGPNGRYYTLTA